MLPPPVLPLGALGFVTGSLVSVAVHRERTSDASLAVVGAVRGGSCLRTHSAPVLTWLWSSGRCGECTSSTSPRLPFAEVGTGLLFAMLASYLGMSPSLPAYLYFGGVAVTLTLIELSHASMPDWILMPSYIVGVLLLMPAGAARADWSAPLRAVSGMVLLGSLYLMLAVAYPPLIRVGAAELAGLLGLYLGWLSWTTLLIGAAGAVFAAAARIGIPRSNGRTAAADLPVAALMGMAGLAAVFLTGPIDHWYASLSALT
jgi:leader peptidase (prepilin peptidase) / N-methyltransferase